jgi:hypothetical protein
MDNALQANIKKVSETLSRYRSGVIAVQANPSLDGLAAATSLYLALTKMGKDVSIACAGNPSADLIGMDKFQNSLASGGNHLVISFPYHEGAIDKVDYSIAGDSFNLIIVPNADTARINPKDVKFSYTGGKVEFVITIDAPNLNSLGQLYAENQGEFQGKTIVNIDRHLINNGFGTVNLVNKQASSTSELVLAVIRDMNVEMDKDMATNLYSGIVAATNNFSSYSVNPMTFEAAAFLMKHGAVKKPVQQQPPKPNGFPPAGFGMPQQNAPLPMQPQQAQQVPQQRQPAPFPFMGSQPAPQQQPRQPHQPDPQYPATQNTDVQQFHAPVESEEPMPLPPDQPGQNPSAPQQGQPQNTQGNKNPQDWLKPKLFRGGNLM